MEVLKAIKERRTIRKFQQKAIDKNILAELVDCARLAAMPANIQPLKFGIITDKELCDKIFPCTKWAGYLPDGTPKENERPVSYIAILGDNEIKKSFEVEAGAAVTNIMLAALEMGIASCWIGALDREGIVKALNLPEKYSVVYMVALGYPMQESVAVDIENGNIKYFMGEGEVLKVPKRTMNEVLVINN